MKRTALLCLAFCAALLSYAQSSPVKWSYTSVKKDAQTYEVKITATINPGWHLYSQTTPDGGPVATKFTFNKNPLLTMDGDVKEEGKMITRHEEVFGVDTKFYADKVDFVQTVKLKGKAKTNASGKFEYMVCNDQQCLPPTTVSFNVTLN
jgi:thiol:disulfide interchange protein DsbD